VPTRKPRRRRLFVVAALIVRRGRVLLSQRRADQTFGLDWEFPGGKVEPGEHPREALVREIREELDCAIRVGPVVDLVFHRYPTFDLVMPVYRATIVRGQPRAAEVAAVQWVERPRLPAMRMPPADVPLARRLARPLRTRGRRRARGRGA
jgi:8-oxo-dGTP diphosphatase